MNYTNEIIIEKHTHQYGRAHIEYGIKKLDVSVMHSEMHMM